MAAFAAQNTRSVAGAQRRARPAFASNSRTRHVVRASVTIPQEFKAVKPVGDRVLVKVGKEETKTAGGLLLPSSAQQKPLAGDIVSAGAVQHVKTGDKVIYSKFAGTDLDVAGEAHVLLKEDDCIGILAGDEKIATLKPLGDRILIKNARLVSQTVGGVLLANDNADKPTFGVVVSVGAGSKNEETGEVVKPNVSVGATVMYSKYSGSEFEEDDENYIVVRESDILAALA